MDISFRKAGINDIEELKKLWMMCFDEMPAALNLFFERNFARSAVYVAELDKKIVSALYLLPCAVNGIRAHYMCGVSTRPGFRGRGYMKRLAAYALGCAQTDGDRYSLLFPANDGLYDFYGSMGYLKRCRAARVTLGRDGFYSDGGIAEGTFPDAERLQKACFKKDFVLWDNKAAEFAAEYYRLYGDGVVCSDNALAFYSVKDKTAYVYYCAYNSFSQLKMLLPSIPAESFELTLSVKNAFGQDAEIFDYGMVKPLGGSQLPEDIFLGFTLN